MKITLLIMSCISLLFVHSCGAVSESTGYSAVLRTVDFGILHPYDFTLAMSARASWENLSEREIDRHFTWQCYESKDTHVVPYDGNPPTSLYPGEVYLTGVAIIIPDINETKILIHSNRTSQLPPDKTELNSVKKFLGEDAHFCVRAELYGIEEADTNLNSPWGKIPSQRYALWNYRALRNHAGVWNHFDNENSEYESLGIRTFDFYEE